MFYQPVIGVGGYAGWKVLQATAGRQQETFENSNVLKREIEYFRENISGARTAEDLVNDRRLLAVALGAYGLGDELYKKAFIQKVLEEGTEKSDAFANRLSEPRYAALSKAFGYGDVGAGSSVLLESFREDVIARYKSLEFERAVGEGDNDMRLAMNFKREIATIASSENAGRVGWFQAMGQAPVREVIQTAFGLPTSTAQLDLDRQREIFEDKAMQLYGDKSPAIFDDPTVVEDVIRRFFLFRQIEAGPSAATPGAGALMMLQSSGIGGAGAINLLLSQA